MGNKVVAVAVKELLTRTLSRPKISLLRFHIIGYRTTEFGLFNTPKMFLCNILNVADFEEKCIW